MKDESINCCHQIPDEAAGQIPSCDCKRLKKGLVVANTELSVNILRCLLSNEGLQAQTPRCTPLLTHTSTGLAISNMLKTMKVSHKCFGILFYGAEKQTGTFRTSGLVVFLEEEA